MVCDLPPGGRDQNNFSLFRLFRGNGSWCRISRIQSPSHHIISELKSSPQSFRSFIAHSAQDSLDRIALTSMSAESSWYLVIESLDSLELSLSTRFTSSLTLSRSASTISWVR